MEIFSCGCCNKTFPTLHKHTHHKNPKALGGKDTIGNLVDLCPSCHDAAHAIAYRMLSRKSSMTQILDAIALIYPDNKKAQEVCLDLSLLIRNASIENQEKDLGPNHLVNIGTVIRKYFKPLIAQRVSEMATSQEGYVRGLILTDLAKRFNLKLSMVEENNIIKRIQKGKVLGI